MEAALARQGLRVFDVERLATHGGSLRVFCCRRDPARRPRPCWRCGRRKPRAAWADDGLLQRLRPRVRAVLDGLRAWLDEAAAEGRRVCAYGAAAKGNTLLNAAASAPPISWRWRTASSAKQGRLLPGSRIPVVSPEAMLAFRPDDILILPWNIEAEVAGQICARRASPAGWPWRCRG